MNKGIYIYSPDFRSYDLGPQHPLKPTRLTRTHELLECYRALEHVEVEEPQPATAEDRSHVRAVASQRGHVPVRRSAAGFLPGCCMRACRRVSLRFGSIARYHIHVHLRPVPWYRFVLLSSLLTGEKRVVYLDADNGGRSCSPAVACVYVWAAARLPGASACCP